MTIAVLGAGVMGSTLLAALVRSGHDPAQLVVSDKSPGRAEEIAAQHGVRAASSTAAVEQGDVVVLAVKPQDMEALIEEIHDHVRPHTLVVSIAAAISTDFLERRLPEGTSVVRVMPNTPALVDQGMSGMSPGRHCTAVQLDQARALMESVGRVIVLDEAHQDAVTAISGSGPAYIFYVVEAMIEAGVLLGLPRDTSTELVVQTLYGAATMLRETGTHPTVLRERVSSPGGTSVAALRALEDHKVRAAFLTAMEAAARRSRELSPPAG
ncbi:pyrroline-5-carboxylate reductase [Ornithinimicrobium tianjinense]|uniref:Pyrroline-5-carboxylate reductase n=1 Tax=Ornithinimicrobium tianjinense TaxID=1195761 RepID=A0A917F145_9MICO|nr:pyrroline-5-carboxylate reductase [Ornithinimicrobium tianjinense]GGF37911.1 pyrroline-5-carboxylate reductase [Ornithinimicrobium tianjinense]